MANDSRFSGTAEEFMNYSKELTGKGVGTFHTVQSCEVVIRRDRAYAVSLVGGHFRFGYAGYTYEYEGWCHHVQRLKRFASGQWRIVQQQAIYLRDGIRVPYPQKGATERLERDFQPTVGRESYKCLSWQMKVASRIQLEDTLPGWDDPDSVEAVMSPTKAWCLDGHVPRRDVVAHRAVVEETPEIVVDAPSPL